MTAKKKSTLGPQRDQGRVPFFSPSPTTGEATIPAAEPPPPRPPRWNAERVAKVNAVAPKGDGLKRTRTPRKELKPLGTERAVMTRVEAAEYLGVSVPTLWRLVREGTVPHVLIGKRARYRREDLDGYLEGARSTTWAPTPGNSRRKS